ncbi:hypothetical protein FJY68_02885 [candidate division WOR-3 bacterium]|uniref:Uncharacterized protein n=1 Tax=candidate division WOR-3 bacterium TaxID=2052148 RepID=A0A937XCQ1_UNCW3|nr:hypothetical protein [candidate division WOR-3 bacterium]
MFSALCLALLAYAPVQFLQTEVTLSKGSSWSQDFILAPGDSLKVDASCLRQVGSSCGCLGGLGDLFMRKGDNVGRAVLAEWHGGIITSVYEQCKPEILYYTDKGGAFTLSIENHSGHRTNLYFITAARIPAQKKYAEFDASFRADTSYETTWVEKPVFKAFHDTVQELKRWTDTTYETVLQSVLTTDIVLEGTQMLEFELPEGSTGELAYSMFSNEAALRQKNEEVKGSITTMGRALTLVNPAYGLLAEVISAVSNPDGMNYSYKMYEGRTNWRGETDPRLFGYATGVANVVGKKEGVRVGTPCVLTITAGSKSLGQGVGEFFGGSKPKVHIDLATNVLEPRMERKSAQVQVVKERKEQTGTRKVPKVESSVTPHLPWK